MKNNEYPRVKPAEKVSSTASVKKIESSQEKNPQPKSVKKNSLTTNEKSVLGTGTASAPLKKFSSLTASVKNENIGIHLKKDQGSSLMSTRTPRIKTFTDLEPNLTDETEIKYLEHKFIQCNIPRTDQKIEAVLPDQLTNILQTLTIIQQKKDTKSKQANDIRAIISKISKLLHEMSTRPILKIHEFRTDYTTQCQDTSNKINNLIKEHSSGKGKSYMKLLRDIKKADKEVRDKKSKIDELKQKMEEYRLSQKIKSSDPMIRLKSSISEQQMLKAEIKFNASQFKKYKKLLTEKEFAKQKSIGQLEHLKKSAAKMKEKVKVAEESSVITANEEEVFYGGMLTKYVKMKHKSKDPVKMENSTNVKKTIVKSIKK